MLVGEGNRDRGPLGAAQVCRRADAWGADAWVSVEACGQALIDAVPQPGKRIVRRREYNLMLKNVVQIHVPSAVAVESGYGSAVVVFSDEVLVAWVACLVG